MASLAQWLHIGFIPEQRVVPAMGDDVVDDRRGREPIIPAALCT